jgi:hypothetical protein
VSGDSAITVPLHIAFTLISESNVPFQILARRPHWAVIEISSADECGAEVDSI